MYTLEAMDNEILRRLYSFGILDIHGGWERESSLNKNAVERLFNAQLIEKSISPGFIRLSARGVGAVLFGFHNADKIFELL